MKNQPPRIFDRRHVRMRRTRSASFFEDHDFLHRRVMEDIVDRLETVKRRFPFALFDGAGALTELLTPQCGVDEIISMDAAPGRLQNARPAFIADAESLPIAPQSLDLYVSLLTLHSANDLVGALAQARHALKPDGLFIAAVFGESTLQNLRNSLLEAEAEVTGGAAARFAPLAAIQDFGQALTRAGFALPVTDIDKVAIDYREPQQLLKDLRGMGETGALAQHAPPLRRTIIQKMLENFIAKGGREYFDIVFLTGWAPHPDQQKPLKPGSAKTSLAEAVRRKT